MEQTKQPSDLAHEMKAALADAEASLRQAAAEVGPKAQELRERAHAALTRAKHAVLDAEEAVVERTKQAAKAGDHWVHEHPWTAIGIAAGVGVLIGLALNRR